MKKEDFIIDGDGTLRAYNGKQEVVEIPEGVTAIDGGKEEIFKWAWYIREIIIPSTTNRIAPDAFLYCDNLTSFCVDEDNPSFSTNARGILFNKDKTMIVNYPKGIRCASYTIPDSVKVIGESAFLASALTSVRMPDTIEEIRDYAFCGCENLRFVRIPNGVKRIGEWAFSSCESITRFSIPASVEHIGKGAFDSGEKLRAIHVDEENAAFSSDEYGVLFNKKGTALIRCPMGFDMNYYTVPDGVTNICVLAFDDCWNLKTISLPDSIADIGDMAFSCCRALDTVYYTTPQYNAFRIGTMNEELIEADWIGQNKW